MSPNEYAHEDQHEYLMILDDSATGADLPLLDLPAECRVSDAADALEAFFLDDVDATAVRVTVGDEPVGVSSRARLLALGSAVLRSLGDGAGATLPGASLRYRILRFHCLTCGARARRVHVDRRAAPACPNGHGTLEPEA